MQRRSNFKMYPQHGQYPVTRRESTMLARDDKPGAQGVDVTAPCDQQNFRSSDNFLKNSFKSDVALKQEFTRYQSRKYHKETTQADPARRKKKRNVEKVCETSPNRKIVAYALISTVPITVRAESVFRSNSNIRTQGCAKPEYQCHAT